MIRRGITFGVWDMLHYGHLRLFERAKEHVDVLVVGVCGDALNLKLKGAKPIISEENRRYLVQGMKPVGETFIYRDVSYVREIQERECNVFIAGEEFGKQGVKEHLDLIQFCLKNGIQIVRLNRTPDVSTTQIKKEAGNAR